MSVELVEFLRARLDEDEDRAKQMAGAVWPEFITVVPSMDTGVPSEGEPVGSVGVNPGHGHAYARIWNPAAKLNYDQGWSMHRSAVDVWSKDIAARTLADIAAKRKTISFYEAAVARPDSDHVSFHWSDILQLVLRSMSSPYADHPRYREAWKL